MLQFLVFFTHISLFGGKAIALERGEIISVKPLSKVICPSGLGVSRISVKYLTVGLDGLFTQASGLVTFPEDSQLGSFPIVSYQHGTILRTDQVPSQGALVETGVACRFGQKSILSAPDYLGLGESAGFHPYLHAETEASASIDLLRAAVRLVRQNGIAWNGKLHLTGYSQGGHATLALLKEISVGNTEFRVTSTAALSGPYDLSETTLKATLNDPAPYESAFYTAFMLSAYHKIYPTVQLETLFVSEYDRYIRAFLLHDVDMASKLTPVLPTDLFLKGVVETVLSSPDHPLVQALQKNNVYDFLPMGPVFLCSGGADKTVTPLNVAQVQESMLKVGAVLTVVNAGDTLNHSQAYVPCENKAVEFFGLN